MRGLHRRSRAFLPRVEFPKKRVPIAAFLFAKIREKRSDGAPMFTRVFIAPGISQNARTYRRISLREN